MIRLLTADTPFPPLEQALANPNGLLAAGGDLSPQRLLTAYQQGIFPWFSPGEMILWWSPNPRLLLFPREIRISRSLRKTLRKRHYEIRTDTAFTEVMQACAATRQGQSGTWIHPEIITAYTALHHQGIAHSVETWIDGQLVGGLYGVAIGKAFFGESMFSHVTDSSKIALVHLAGQLAAWDYGLIDCQMKTNHLVSMGAREVLREWFAGYLEKLVTLPAPAPNSRWQFDYTYPK